MLSIAFQVTSMQPRRIALNQFKILAGHHGRRFRQFHNAASVYNRSQAENYDGTQSSFSPEDEQAVLAKLKVQFEEESKTLGSVPVFKRALLHGNSIAIKDQNGEFSYAKLYIAAKRLSADISSICGNATNSRIAFLCPNDVSYPLIQWAIWMSGQIAVPLSAKHPDELLKYFVSDSDASLLISTPEVEARMKGVGDSLNKKLLVIDHSSLIPTNPFPAGSSWLDPRHELVNDDGRILNHHLEPQFYAENNAMLLYTSGTTGKPKGVIISHKNLDAQVRALSHAWQFSTKDCLLHVLPLNHVHGCVNALLCPLHSGAKTIMLPRYETNAVWSHLLNVNMPGKDRITVFMAVPTIYSFLIEEYQKIFAKNSRMCEYIRMHCSTYTRLMVCGSAPLPTNVFQKWYDLSGHRLLERYGMTEIGMALSNPYVEEGSSNRQRIPGTVGGPLPGVEVKIKTAHNNTTVHQQQGEFEKGFWKPASAEDCTTAKSSGAAAVAPPAPVQSNEESAIVGDLYVRGPSVFKGYWNRPEATQEAFFNGWFKTGDTVSYDEKTGNYKILGRTNIDIIKTGGHKLSALEVETVLLEHPLIEDCAALGLPDDVWGQKVGVIVQLSSTAMQERSKDVDTKGEAKKKPLTLKELNQWCSKRLPSYAIPTVLSIVENIPRNAMGKVNKREIIQTVNDKKVELEKQQQQQQQLDGGKK